MIANRHYGECDPSSCAQGGSIEKRRAACPERKPVCRIRRCGGPLSLLLVLTASIVVAGCVGGSQKEEGSQTPTILVSLMQSPPSSLTVGLTASVSATVSNDVANAGVDWVAVCGSAPNCGLFSPPHTASGVPTTFTAPIGVPVGNTVAVTALSSTDHGKASAATVTIISTVTGVTITQTPPPTFPSGGSLSVAATVAGDPSSEGVDWKAKCGGVDCTSAFLGAHSAPGVATTFVVPLQNVTFPMIVGSTVTVTAFATADHNFSASATFTVTGAISINITQEPSPPALFVDTSATFKATVANDPTSSGVTWTIVSCDAAPCGSWSQNSVVLSTKVASDTPVTYTAPPTAVNHVIIQAAASASPLNAMASVEISITAGISVTISQGVRNNTIVESATAPLVATVSGDSANAGVNWTVTCTTTGACGSFSLPHTPSGAATTFTAPATVPTGNLSVIITVTSTTDPTKSASQTVTVTASVPPVSLLSGNFVMLLTGRDANGGPYALGGVIVGNGIGNITVGSLDLVDLGGGVGNTNAGNVPVLSTSSYSLAKDGRGQINLTVNTGILSGNFGLNASGSIVLSVVFVTPKHALLSESDGFGIGTGTLDLQNAADLASFQNGTSGLNGVYSLSLTGAEIASPNPKYFLLGALTIGAGRETAFIADQSDKGVITSVPSHPASHPFSNPAPSSFGEIMLDSVDFGLPTKFSLDAWLIDANHFVVVDWRDSFSGTPNVIVSGYMVIQPSSPAISATYAFTEAGESAAPSFTPQAVGGIFACGSTGTLDLTPLSGTHLNIPTISAACTAPASGRGLITISGAGTTGISKFAAYPTLDQGLYLIELDGGSPGSSGPSGAGLARQQTLPAPIVVSNFSGNYASNFLADTVQGFEAFAGQITSNGVSLVSGTVDVNSFKIAPPPGPGTPSLNATLTGSFTAATDGRFPLFPPALVIGPAAGQPLPQVTSINPVCYILDANTCLLLGLDATAPGTGILELQNTGL
jgi:hypothetical protein